MLTRATGKISTLGIDEVIGGNRENLKRRKRRWRKKSKKRR